VEKRKSEIPDPDPDPLAALRVIAELMTGLDIDERVNLLREIATAAINQTLDAVAAIDPIVAGRVKAKLEDEAIEG